MLVPPGHKGMPTIAPGHKIDFLRRQVLTSRNVRGGGFTDLFLGGLNYQVEHHLFPNMPRVNLRKAQAVAATTAAAMIHQRRRVPQRQRIAEASTAHGAAGRPSG